MEQYEFRYKLDDDVQESNVFTLEEFYQNIIVSLLGIVEFTNDGSIVEIDGFRFINSSNNISLFNRRQSVINE